MQIKTIKINSYGNLKEKEINLKNNFNIIYGKNETGKSTLLNFIKNIFYGISKNKNGRNISDYEKYKPWIGEEFSGKIKYELDNGKIFEVYRDFGKKNPKLYNENMEDISGEFKIDKKDGNQFFFEQVGIDEQTYSSTILTCQQEIKLGDQERSTLVQKVANLAGTGDDTVSYKKAMDKLNKRQLEEVGNSRTQDRPVNIIGNRLKIIEFDLMTKNDKEKTKIGIQEEKQTIKQQLITQKNKNNTLNQFYKLINNKNMKLEKNKIKEEIKKQKEEKIKELIIQKNNLQKNDQEIKVKNNNQIKNKLNIIFITLLFLSIIINIFNFILIKNKIINYLLLFLIPIILIIYFMQYKKNKRKKEKKKIQNKEEQEKLNFMNVQIDLLKNEIENLNQEIQKENQQIEIQFINEKQILEKQFMNLQFINENQVEHEIEKTNEIITNYQLAINKLELEEKANINELEKYIQLEEEYENLKEQLQELEQKNKIIEITKQLIEKAYEEMKKTVTPKFTKQLSHNIAIISNQKYKNVMINDEEGLMVELENGEYIPADRLSMGTIDQLYLSLRLSVIDDIAKEPVPIFLDESFAYYDDQRLTNILLYLIEYAKTNQIIIFTCTQREKNILDNLKQEYHLVNLSHGDVS